MLFLEAPQKGYVKDVINGKYELSKSGVLVHKRTRKVVKGCKDKKGYIFDSFKIDGKTISKKRHRLVWETFIGEIPEGMEINHISEDKQDNRICNLNLLSHKANLNWGTRNERSAKANTNHPKKSKSVIQKSLDGKIIKIWPSIMEVHRKFGYSHGAICECCNGKKYRNTAYGYKWEYAEE